MPLILVVGGLLIIYLVLTGKMKAVTALLTGSITRTPPVSTSKRRNE